MKDMISEEEAKEILFDPKEVDQVIDDNPFKEEEKKGKPMDEYFPKFQYSVFSGPDKRGQYVVRSNDYEDFLDLVGKVTELLPPPIPTAPPSYPPRQEAFVPTVARGAMDNLDATCPIHGVQMEQKTGKYGNYWSHTTEGGYCNGHKITPFRGR